MGRPDLPRRNLRVLLDTHALLWWGMDPDRLSRPVYSLIESGATDLVWSVAGTIEIATKVGKGKLAVPGTVESFVEAKRTELDLEILPISNRHAVRLADLPRIHGDPLDRILVAQAQVEGLPLVTADPRFRAYGVEVIW